MSDSSNEASTIVNVDMIDVIGVQNDEGGVESEAFVPDSEHVVVSDNFSACVG